jgi:hypothetical protein
LKASLMQVGHIPYSQSGLEHWKATSSDSKQIVQ